MPFFLFIYHWTHFALHWSFPPALAWIFTILQPMGSKGRYLKKCPKPCRPSRSKETWTKYTPETLSPTQTRNNHEKYTFCAIKSLEHLTIFKLAASSKAKSISWGGPFKAKINVKKFLPAQEGETFSSGCLETVGVGGHLQALLQAVQGLPDHRQSLSSSEQCCGSRSGIRCFFDPWIRIRGPESGMSFFRVQDLGSWIPDPSSVTIFWVTNT